MRKKQYLCKRIKGKVVWVVERAALEMRYTRKRIEGSNPPLSANKNKTVCPSLLEQAVLFFLCKDAVGRLRDYAEIPHLLDAVGRIKGNLTLIYLSSNVPSE